jgi:pimeloyl-ACP methyl ester carboxylesterase
MQRPVMHPVFRAEDVVAVKKKTPKWKLFLKNTVGKYGAAGLKYLLSSPVRFGSRSGDAGKPPLVSRFVKGLAYRALFLPILLVLSTTTLVFTGTHPSIAYSAVDPNSYGIYAETVAFDSEDGTRLEGWIAPVIDAKAIIEKKERALRTKHPAVILVHDFGQPPQTVLPLFPPLHEDGLVVMAMGLRGCTSSSLQTAGQTFGLHEAMDVKAAVDILRQAPFVDGSRIAVVGVGSGATAAVLAARTDPQIRATVLIDPVGDPEEVLRKHIGPERAGLRWMQPLCKWTFELGYRVDAEEMQIDRFPEVTRNRPSLVMDSKGDGSFLSNPKTIDQVRVFLCDKLRLQLNPGKGNVSGVMTR